MKLVNCTNRTVNFMNGKGEKISIEPEFEYKPAKYIKTDEFDGMEVFARILGDNLPDPVYDEEVLYIVSVETMLSHPDRYDIFSPMRYKNVDGEFYATAWWMNQ